MGSEIMSQMATGMIWVYYTLTSLISRMSHTMATPSGQAQPTT